MLTTEAPTAIHWLEEHGVEFTRDNGGYRLARCGGATRKRLLQVGDRTGLAITMALKDAFEAGSGTAFPKSPLSSLDRIENGWRATCGEHVIDAATVVLAAGGRCFREAEERGELTTNHPGATGEVTQIALGLGAEARDLDALQYHPNGGAWPEAMQGYSIPETTRAYGAEAERDLRHLAGCAWMVRRELTALLGDAETPPARCEDHRRGDDRVIPAARAPTVLGPGEVGER